MSHAHASTYQWEGRPLAMTGPDKYAWTELGHMLEHRRVEISPRYRNLTLFCAEREIDYRLAWDLEHARRDNYRRPTLMAAEAAYDLPRGRIADFLAKARLAAAAGGVLGDALDN